MRGWQAKKIPRTPRGRRGPATGSGMSTLACCANNSRSFRAHGPRLKDPAEISHPGDARQGSSRAADDGRPIPCGQAPPKPKRSCELGPGPPPPGGNDGGVKKTLAQLPSSALNAYLDRGRPSGAPVRGTWWPGEQRRPCTPNCSPALRCREVCSATGTKFRKRNRATLAVRPLARRSPGARTDSWQTPRTRE
jgi:hypothetical protein